MYESLGVQLILDYVFFISKYQNKKLAPIKAVRIRFNSIAQSMYSDKYKSVGIYEVERLTGRKKKC